MRRGDARVAVDEALDHLALAVSGGEEHHVSGPVHRGHGERHPHAAAVGQRDRHVEVTHVDDGIARGPRGGAPVVAQTEVHDVEHAVTSDLLDLLRVAEARRGEVARGHIHEVGHDGHEVEEVRLQIAEVAIGIAIGRYPLVDLEHVDLPPGQVELGEGRVTSRPASIRH